MTPTTSAQDRVADEPERKVLVGRIYGSLHTTWNEWDQPFAEVVDAITERAQDRKASGHPDEIIEVIVVRRAQIRAVVTVDIASADDA